MRIFNAWMIAAIQAMQPEHHLPALFHCHQLTIRSRITIVLTVQILARVLHLPPMTVLSLTPHYHPLVVTKCKAQELAALEAMQTLEDHSSSLHPYKETIIIYIHL